MSGKSIAGLVCRLCQNVPGIHFWVHAGYYPLSPSDSSCVLQMDMVYAGMSMLEHSCIPNTWGVKTHMVGEWVLITQRDVKQGEHLSVSYMVRLTNAHSENNRLLLHLVDHRLLIYRYKIYSDP